MMVTNVTVTVTQSYNTIKGYRCYELKTSIKSKEQFLN